METNSVDLLEKLGLLSETLKSMHVDEDSLLTVKLSDEHFKKLDEDLYYRQNNSKDEYIPADDEIDLNFGKLKVKFLKQYKEKRNGK